MKVLIKFLVLFTLSFIIVMGAVTAFIYSFRDKELPGEKWIQSQIQEAAIDSSAITGVPTAEQLRAMDYEKRQLALNEREVKIDNDEERINVKMDSLNQVKEQLEMLIGTKQGIKETRIKKLAKVYEGMRPEEAAPILSELDDLTIIDIMLQMSDRSVSKILGQMPVDRATEISQRLSGTF